MNGSHENNTTHFLLKKSSLLLISFVLITAAGMRWNVEVAGWLYPVFLLLYMRMGYGQKPLALVLVAAVTLQVMKIVSAPLHIMIAVMSGLQAGLGIWLILWLVQKMRQRSNLSGAILALLFASLMTLMEYLGAMFSPLGVWGMAANIEIDNPALLQVASLTGAYGVSFLMMWTAAVLESLLYPVLLQKPIARQSLKGLAALAGVFFAVYLYGAVRLDTQSKGPHIQAAAVSAKLYGVMDVFQSEAARLGNNEEVFELVKNAAATNDLVITNEGAIVLLPDEVQKTREKISQMALATKTDLIFGYLIFHGLGQKFGNKMLVVDASGNIRQDYFKQFIPPGEPSLRGFSEIEAIPLSAGDVGYMAGGAICYDFDSMAIAGTLAKRGAGLVAVPASDWRGIDPIHTAMVRLRAIEQGYTVVRSTRAAASAAYDAYGRVRGYLPWHEEGSQTLSVSVPVEPVFTVYKLLGDWFVYLNILFCGWALWRLRKSPAVRS